MAAQNILIVVVDGLRAAALGAYGNTTFPTPALDFFAADSFLLDSCYAASSDLSTNYRALWQSQHPVRPAPPATFPSLPQLLKSHGYDSTLVTDDGALPSLPGAEEFDRGIQLEEPSRSFSSPGRPGDSSETSFARLFQAAADAVAASGSGAPRFVWVHSRGMYGPWDAPLALQESLRDEGDPPPVEAVAPPDITLAQDADPDAIFRFASAYAAQCIVLDDCWQNLLHAVQSSAAGEGWLVTLIGARGFPLGEHLRIGGVDQRLYAEQLHVPWLLQLPDGTGKLARSGRLTSLVDLPRTIAHAANVEWGPTPNQTDHTDGMSALPLASDTASPWRSTLVATDGYGTRAIRTPEWCLRVVSKDLQDQPQNDVETVTTELYVRPDDRWEANDVAKLCPDVVDSLLQEMEGALQRLAQ